jgi:glutamyl-Q tRNA(Asp) synthetase
MGALTRGRFAPSPTGPLHFGSLISALGSFLQARSQGGEWLLRIEDIDPPRAMPGATDSILRALEAHALYWDGPVCYQSRRVEAYQDALEQLCRQEAVYFCGCSRKDIAEQGQRLGLLPGVYPGTCRGRRRPGRGPRAARLLTGNQVIGFDDAVQGAFQQDLPREVGDFVLRRADRVFAYQLAVVIDDAASGITEIVRGSDLLDSTPRQIYLQRLLCLPTPVYAHLPVALNALGEKLSKQTFAAPLDLADPMPALCRALDFLGHPPPAELRLGDPASLIDWAIRHWRLEAVPRRLRQPVF